MMVPIRGMGRSDDRAMQRLLATVTAVSKDHVAYRTEQGHEGGIEGPLKQIPSLGETVLVEIDYDEYPVRMYRFYIGGRVWPTE